MSITAVLAPTNTGKTHRAVERMLEHDSGMIGLPLRLLAREVYDRVTAERGEAEVALVTGEEKRIPARPRYWVCTVEAMPVSREVDFLAVDEIQLAAHRRRGHVFTDRLLHARGRRETWFMGAETMRDLIADLVPGAHIARYPRLSQLRHAGTRSLRSLPPRSAVVAFSAPHVYELAERLRQRRGGVAVVLGARSPRTRNAQVALYQSGEVHYMVATDAIGMGLNMDVDHVAFAALRKYDGHSERPLEIDELAQIAGRAGRYQSDGTFGTVTPLGELSPRVVDAIENHRFRPVEQLVWRNSDLDLSSVDALIQSLSRRSQRGALRLVEYAEDFSALARLAAMDDIRTRARGREAVALLWDVCQIPDFRKLLEDSHVKLLATLYNQLSGPTGRIDTDWMSRRIGRLDDPNGDIDTLMRRIAFVRTWTYISHHTHWVAGAAQWQEETRAIEDRLSDALHERLVQRFVSRQRSRRAVAAAAPDPDHPFGKLRDLLGAAAGSRPGDPQAGRGAEHLAERLIAAEHDRFTLDAEGVISFGDSPVARMGRGVDLLRPEVTLLVDDLGAGARSRVLRRLTAWTRDLAADALAPLRRDEARNLSPAGRGLVYQLERTLGTVFRRQARDQLRDLADRDRAILRTLGVRVGRRLVYVPGLLAPPAVERRVALVSAYLAPVRSLAAPDPTATSIPASDDVDAELYTAIGFPRFGPRAIRSDIAEKIHRALADRARGGRPFTLPEPLASWLGCPADAVTDVVVEFGYQPRDDGRFAARGRRPNRNRRRSPSGRNGRRKPRADGGD